MAESKRQTSVKSNGSNGVRSTRLYKSRARSKVTNGVSILPNVDGRIFWVRRYRDINALLLSGLKNPSEELKMRARRIACLEVELERRETLYAEADGATDAQMEVYQRSANTSNRSLREFNQLVERERQNQISVTTPTVQEYLAQRRSANSEAAE